MNYHPTSMNHGHSQKYDILSVVNFPAFYGPQKFINVFKSAHFWFLSSIRRNQPTSSYPI